MGTKPDSTLWDPQTRVSLPKSPELVLAKQDGVEPYATATDSKGAEAYFVRDSNYQWHRVSGEDRDRIIEWAIGGELKITPTCGVLHIANPKDGGFSVQVLPFEEAA